MSFFDHFWALFPLARTPTQKTFPQSHFTVYNADFFLWPPFTQWHGWLRERSSIQFFFFLEHPSKQCIFSGTRCGSECMAVTSKIVLSRYQSVPFDGYSTQIQVTCLPDEEVRRGVRSYSGSLPRPRTSAGRQVRRADTNHVTHILQRAVTQGRRSTPGGRPVSAR